MLPVLDDRQSNGRNTQIRGRITFEGVELIHEKLRSTLISKGLEQVEVKAGDAFDADLKQ
jgi:molecular chaperone GrpE